VKNDLDPAIVRRACEGDEHAFRVIVETHGRAVYNIAYRYAADRDAAFDLSQEIFLHAHKNLSRYDRARPFEPWFFRVAMNFAMNWVRGRRKGEVSLDSFEGDATPAVDENPPGERIERAEEALKVRAAVSALPEPYRQIVALRYLEGMSLEEVGEILELPEGTVKNRLFRARDMLKERLEHAGLGPETACRKNGKIPAADETPPQPHG
jgi:RNA polymerase sigma-70 factor (ECF subfamily)